MTSIVVMEPTTAAVGELLLDFVSSSSTLLVIGAAHNGSLKDEISTGQLSSNLKTVDSLSINLPPVTMFCIMISKSSRVN